MTLPQPQRLLIVRLSAMGDIIHALPAAAALRHAFPQAAIGWLLEERWAELLCARSAPRSGPRSPQRPLVDRVHTVDTKRWRKSLLSPQTCRELRHAVEELRASSYDLAIDFQGLIRSSIFARLSRAPTRFGFANPRESIARWFYTVPVRSRGTHVIEQNLSLAASVTSQTIPLPSAQLPRDDAADQEISNRLAARGLQQYALLNPGAGWGAKRWPAERYGAVAKELSADGVRSLINFGPGEESLAQSVADASAGAAEPISCSLGELIALTRGACLFIGGDTGPLHLAAALGVPVIAIFGPTDPARNGPFVKSAIVLRNPASQTSHTRRAQPDAGILQITASQVLTCARKVVRGPA